MKKQIQGGLSLLLATIIWGSAFVSQSVAMAHIGPFSFQAIRCALAVLGLLAVIPFADRYKKDGSTFLKRFRSQKLWKAGVLCGVPLFLACNLQQLGLVDVDPGKSAFLTAMYIVLVPIIGIFRKQKITALMPISVMLAVAGLYCLSCIGVTEIALGDILLLGCALMFAVQITFVDIFAQDIDPLRLNLLQSLVCSVLSAVVMVFTEKPTFDGIWLSALPLAHTGFLSMGAAYALQIMGQKHLQANTASLIMSLESVFAVLFGWLILGKTLTNWESIGCILVFAAVILSQIPTKQPKNS